MIADEPPSEHTTNSAETPEDGQDQGTSGGSIRTIAEVDSYELGIVARLIDDLGESRERILAWYSQPDLRLLPLVGGVGEVPLADVLPVPVSLVGARTVECTTKRATIGDLSRSRLLCLSDPGLISRGRLQDGDSLRRISPQVVDGRARIDGRALPAGRWTLFAIARDGDPYAVERGDLFVLKRMARSIRPRSPNGDERTDFMHLLMCGLLLDAWAAARRPGAARQRLKPAAFMIWTQCLLLFPSVRTEMAGVLDDQLGAIVLGQLDSIPKILDAWRQDLIEEWNEV